MGDTRQQILYLIQQRSADTVEHLSLSLGLAPASIRRHLDILQRDGLIAFRAVRKKVGRPQYSYYLTEVGQEAQPKDYHRLLGLLVQELATVASQEEARAETQSLAELLFSRIAQRMTQPHVDHLNGASLPERLATTLEVLREHSFSPELEEAHGESVRIRLHNCPFRYVALEHGVVCSFDRSLIAQLSGAVVTLGECIAEGKESCSYRLSPIEPPA